jgi:hypothetical protein
MPVNATTHPTMADLAKMIGPDGGYMEIAETLHQANEVNLDAVWLPTNKTTSHMALVRTGIPLPTWMKLNNGIPPTKGETSPIEDQTALLGNYHEVACELADLYGNPNTYRMTEATAIIEGFAQEYAQNLFYGNEMVNVEKFTGLAPRFNSLSAMSGRNIVNAGGTGSANTSLWLVGWGPQTIHCIYPKNTKMGLVHEDLGRQTSENFGGTGLRMQIYRSYFSQKVGLHVRDWRFAVRIANIQVANLRADLTSGPDLIDLMYQALNMIPNRSSARFAWYANQTIMGFITRQAMNKKGVQLSLSEIKDNAGMTTGHSIGGIPMRRVDQLLNTEAQVT